VPGPSRVKERIKITLPRNIRLEVWLEPGQLAGVKIFGESTRKKILVSSRKYGAHKSFGWLNAVSVFERR